MVQFILKFWDQAHSFKYKVDERSNIGKYLNVYVSKSLVTFVNLLSNHEHVNSLIYFLVLNLLNNVPLKQKLKAFLVQKLEISMLWKL